MKKPLLMVMVGVSLAITALASPTRTTMGESNIPIIRQTGSQDGQERPHSPALRLFSAYADTDLNIVEVSARYDVGDVDVVLENLSTGESATFSFDSSVTAVFPFRGDAGFWQLTLTLADGTDYVGQFVL